MFERAYALVPLGKTNRADMTQRINEAVMAHDHPRAAASIACMTNDRDDLYILIEYWRCPDGDGKQDPSESVDRPAKVGQPRRPRTRQHDDAGAAPRDQPSSVGDRVGARRARRARSADAAEGRRTRGQLANEIDVPLPFDTALHGIPAIYGTCEEFPNTQRPDYLGQPRERPALPDTPIEWP